MKRTWKVGELARMAGLTIRTLRYYDQIGLYSPSGHSASGHRLYTESDVERLHRILSLKELGLSLDEIRDVMTGDRVGLSDLIAMQIDRLKEQIRRQQKLLRELERASSLMRSSRSLTAEDLTSLLGAMRMNHERFIAERRTSWERHLDRLGDYLDEDHPDDPSRGED
ncbi:MerR family transcriptional regulator [Paenibacillus flagellatus]|uniref:MerR family transcriptional regulator n=1 Tax=Paenibacillus flagellatus TaxID=2211139 RepID=A0A2V5K618_9BACL|nr:MerR family transcriptional regulator [Paenibacillus flagellatus]PYI54815.1 MerR family transcriptional regulator [Paenibacillus flagellatus]